MTIDTTSQAFFENIYQENADPWHFATREYERRRYETILRALAGRRFKHAFEPGCSVGVLTQQLAACCDRVDAIDISPTAVELAQKRCRQSPNAYIVCDSLAHPMPGDIFDLVVFSEIGYYFEEQALRDILLTLVPRIEPKGMLVASHWLGSSPDHILGGHRVHEIIGESDNLIHYRAERYTDFRLDCWSRQ
jgi:2-polyprenyl-3-methyl-5-hydroxy-6-metoxy-1,4-benzoquinol methylase